MKNIYSLKYYLFLATLLLSGCVSIPPEAPELSTELGKRISAIEDANITLLHRFFDQKRQDIDRFIDHEWVPTFAENFFNDSQISEAWQTIVRENDVNERLTFIVKLGPKLQERINEKRTKLIRPLDNLERKIKSQIADEYAQARAINNSITSFLLSASEVTSNRNRYLEKVGVSQTDIGNVIDKTDDAVSGLLQKSGTIQDKVSSAEKYLTKLREIKDSL